MTTQPIERPPTRRQTPERALEVMLGYLPLPTLRIVPGPDAVHVTVASVDDLAAWMDALGGTVHQGPSVDGVSVWSLHTRMPSMARVRVHTVVADREFVDGIRPVPAVAQVGELESLRLRVAELEDLLADSGWDTAAQVAAEDGVAVIGRRVA